MLLLRLLPEIFRKDLLVWVGDFMGVHLYTNGAWTDSGRIYRNSLNLFDPSQVVAGYQYDFSSQTLVPSETLDFLGYIPVSIGSYLRIYENTAIGNFCFVFDENKNLIAQLVPGAGNPIIISSDNVKYIGFNVNQEYDLSKYMFAKTAIVIPYEPYNVVDWYTNNGHGYTSGAWD